MALINKYFRVTEMSPVKILIVDDEAANILLFTKILETQGYNNIVATLEPRKVIALQQQHDFDLVLLDINMPEMNGYEVLEALHNYDECNHTQVIATNGDASSGQIKKALNAGFSAFISKPMRMQEFLTIVDEALQENTCLN
jgi:CheY-like chemotaxis protein